MRLQLLFVGAVAAIAIMFAACSGGGSLPDPTSVGAKLYSANCARCHGADAGGLSGPSLVDNSFTVDEVRTAITDGVDNRMPSFKTTLTAEQIDTLSQYVAGLDDAKSEETEGG